LEERVSKQTNIVAKSSAGTERLDEAANIWARHYKALKTVNVFK
jgi:hypothetical protein